MLNQNQATDKFTHLGGTHGSASGHYCNITLRGSTTSSMVVWIWQRLIDMSRMGKTIVITTHYIEEARQADAVGLMRSGALLAEDSPSYLLEYYNCSTLEDVFLYLCEQDQNNNASKQTNVPASCDKLRSLPNVEESTVLVGKRFSYNRTEFAR
ncbi:ABC transporter G family member 23-like [Diaphorina citri]|uniref:ABC transporter G family member 23-like n=1 Tax=Diaphorina citri TaxID=121845 RepID=A0A3Q0JHB8_DIACI|nr:ABC transporter G family member 23-like [Diaphorina citri]